MFWNYIPIVLLNYTLLEFHSMLKRGWNINILISCINKYHFQLKIIIYIQQVSLKGKRNYKQLKIIRMIMTITILVEQRQGPSYPKDFNNLEMQIMTIKLNVLSKSKTFLFFLLGPFPHILPNTTSIIPDYIIEKIGVTALSELTLGAALCLTK